MPFKLVMLPPQLSKTRGWPERLSAELHGISVVVPDNMELAEEAIHDADAVCGRFLPPELLRKAKRLRWLQAPFAGAPPGYYYPELIAHPLVVTNMRDTFSDHIGTHIMSMVLAFARGLHRYIRHQLQREWRPLPQGEGIIHLPDATALIVGVGGVGCETARLANAFGMRVIGVDVRRKQCPPGMAELHRPDKLDDLLPEADFVLMTAPHTPATEGMFDRARFRRMKRSAFYINTGRGNTTRLDDLVAALVAGNIAGAGLDVFAQGSRAHDSQVRLDDDDPLWTMPGVIITPHVASSGPYMYDRMFEVLLDNCRRFTAGKALRNVVDKENWF